MKLLIVSAVDPWTRSVSTVHHYAAAARALGHEVAVYGPANPDVPALPFTTDLKGVDLALFLVQVPSDFPDMPFLARLIDTIPAEKRAVVDLWGRYNDTIRVDHDFNHLEKLDGHQGWEWDEAIKAVSSTILQPTLRPRRPDVKPFLFHAFDQASVVKPYASAKEAVSGWKDKPHGVVYVGSNWQRWDQMRRFLEQHATVRDAVGEACLCGWDWDKRPEWAADQGIAGVDTDPELLQKLGVQLWPGVKFDQIVGLLGYGRFTPVFHRPVFRELGFVTGRSFETFHADTIPVLMLPRGTVEPIYGSAALTLTPGDDVAAFLADAMKRPEHYWDAVLKTRDHLAKHHSYAKRFEELGALHKSRGA